MSQYTVRGFDSNGNEVSETIEYTPPTFRQKIRNLAVRILPNRISYRLGLTKFRYISGIAVKGALPD